MCVDVDNWIVIVDGRHGRFDRDTRFFFTEDDLIRRPYLITKFVRTEESFLIMSFLLLRQHHGEVFCFFRFFVIVRNTGKYTDVVL